MSYYITFDSSGGLTLAHGSEWQKHKYIRKEGTRYIYPEDLRKTSAKSSSINANKSPMLQKNNVAVKRVSSKSSARKSPNDAITNKKQRKNIKEIIESAKKKVELYKEKGKQIFSKIVGKYNSKIKDLGAQLNRGKKAVEKLFSNEKNKSKHDIGNNEKPTISNQQETAKPNAEPMINLKHLSNIQSLRDDIGRSKGTNTDAYKAANGAVQLYSYGDISYGEAMYLIEHPTETNISLESNEVRSWIKRHGYE